MRQDNDGDTPENSRRLLRRFFVLVRSLDEQKVGFCKNVVVHEEILVGDRGSHGDPLAAAISRGDSDGTLLASRSPHRF